MSSDNRPMSSDNRPMSSYNRPMSSYNRSMSSYNRSMSSSSRPMSSHSRSLSKTKRERPNNGLTKLVENVGEAESIVNKNLGELQQLKETRILEEEYKINQTYSEPGTTDSTLEVLEKNFDFIVKMQTIGYNYEDDEMQHSTTIQNLNQLFSSSDFSEREILKTCKSIIRVMGAQNDDLYSSHPDLQSRKIAYGNTISEEIKKFVNQHEHINQGYIQGDVEFAKEWLKLYKHRQDEEKREEYKENLIKKQGELKERASVAIAQLNLIESNQLNIYQILAYSAFALGIAILPRNPTLGLFVLACSNSKHDIINKQLQPTMFQTTTTPRSQSLFQIFRAILRYEISNFTTRTQMLAGNIVEQILSVEAVSGARDMLLYSSKLMISCIKAHLLNIQEKINIFNNKFKLGYSYSKNNSSLVERNSLVRRAQAQEKLRSQIKKEGRGYNSNTKYKYPIFFEKKITRKKRRTKKKNNNDNNY